MKKAVLIIIAFLLLYIAVGWATSNSDNDGVYIAPDYVTSFYDYYTLNYLNSRALGMGNTGIILQGGVEYALTNPASLRAREVSIYVEGNAKNEVEEPNRYIKETKKLDGSIELKEVPDEAQRYEAGTPAITCGVAYSPVEPLSLGLSFSMPQTIRYNVFGRLLKTESYIDRYPTMINYQGTATATGHIGNFNFGLNTIMNVYSFNNLRIENTFNRLGFTKSVMRFQPGILYKSELFSVGMSYKLPTNSTFKVQNTASSNTPLYHTYDVELPGVIEGGVSFNYNETSTVALAIEYEQTGSQYDDFKDRLKIKAGIEKNLPKYSLRGGVINVPSIYSGRHDVIVDDSEVGRRNQELYDVTYSYLEVEDTDQLIVTGGATYHLPNVDFSIALAQDVLGNVGVFQVSCSFDIKLGKIIRETNKK